MPLHCDLPPAKRRSLTTSLSSIPCRPDALCRTFQAFGLLLLGSSEEIALVEESYNLLMRIEHVLWRSVPRWSDESFSLYQGIRPRGFALPDCGHASHYDFGFLCESSAECQLPDRQPRLARALIR
jgi:hypothetical protein